MLLLREHSLAQFIQPGPRRVEMLRASSLPQPPQARVLRLRQQESWVLMGFYSQLLVERLWQRCEGIAADFPTYIR